jgi:prepilin-type N-terminal cleavage/methylation domain-containing protein
MCCIKNNRRAFSLIELVVVLALFAVVALAVYGSLRSGLAIFKRVTSVQPQVDINLLFERFETDVRSGFKFSKIKFFGGEAAFEFPGFVESAIVGETVGKISYVFDAGRRRVLRISSDYSQVCTEGQGSTQTMLAGVRDLRFSYYFYDTEKGRFRWIDEWLSSGIPSAVRMELMLTESPDYIVKTVTIPIGGQT